MPPNIFIRQPPDNAWILFDLATISTVAIRQPPNNQWVNFTIGSPTGWMAGPTAAYQLFISTGVGAGSWTVNPLLSVATNVFGRVLPNALVDQDRAFAIGAAFNYDIPLGASTENAFSIVINTNDGVNRLTLRYMARARRVAATVTSGVALVLLQTDPLWTLVGVASVNKLRLTLT